MSRAIKMSKKSVCKLFALSLVIFALGSSLGIVWDDVRAQYHERSMKNAKERALELGRAGEYGRQADAIKDWKHHRRALLEMGFLRRWTYYLGKSQGGGRPSKNTIIAEANSHTGEHTIYKLRDAKHAYKLIVWDRLHREDVWQNFAAKRVCKSKGAAYPASQERRKHHLPKGAEAVFRGEWVAEKNEVMYRISVSDGGNLQIETVNDSRAWGRITTYKFKDPSIILFQKFRPARMNGSVKAQVTLAPVGEAQNKLQMRTVVDGEVIDNRVLTRKHVGPVSQPNEL
jgi:hypothetical protein